MLEKDLSQPVVDWLTNRGFTAYCEVPWFACSLDVVGISEEAVEVVELKLSLTKHVIYQACRSLSSAHSAWCAVATVPRKIESRLSYKSTKNIGVLRVVGGRVEVIKEAVADYETSGRWDRGLRETCSRMEPGGCAGMPTMRGAGPAQLVFDNVLKYRAENRSAKWDEIWRKVPNHYVNARSMEGAMRVVRDNRAWYRIKPRVIIKKISRPDPPESQK